MSERLAFGLGLFFLSLLAGWMLRRVKRLGDARANRIIRFVSLWLSPVTSCLSFWRLQAYGPQLLILPIIGCLASFSTLLPARWYARRANLTKPQTGSFLTCAFFSNLGYFGGFLAFALLGEAAYGLCLAYLMYFTPAFYLWGFAVAKRYGTGAQASGAAIQPAELRLPPMLGMALGLTLALARVPRPACFEPINHVLIPVSTALYLTAMGTRLSIRLPSRWLNAGVAMSAIKFLYTPLIGWLLCELFHVHGLMRQVVLLQTAMPAAISPLMLTMLFGTDRSLANALLMFTTLLALPWMLVYLPLIY